MKENFSKKLSTGSVPTRTNNIIVHLFSMDAKSLSTRLCRILFHSSRSRFCKSKKGNGSIGLAAMRCPNVSRCARLDLNQECMVETPCAACTYKSSFMQSGIIIHWIKDFLMAVVYDQSHTSMRYFHPVFTSFGRQIVIPYIMTCKFTRTSILIAVQFINPPMIPQLPQLTLIASLPYFSEDKYNLFYLYDLFWTKQMKSNKYHIEI